MKRFIILLLLVLVGLWASCAPLVEYPISEEQLTKLEHQQAIDDWIDVDATTDECSSPANIKWLASACVDRVWFDCCFQHDFDYRHGWKYDITREQADYALWECVDAAGPRVVANAMYTAVYVFGRWYYNERD